MRVVITNERLGQRAGSDLFVRDLARGLQQLGHMVVAYGSDLRERERLLERDSIPVVVDLESLPFRPDIIHARHHLDAMTAVMALPGVPAIYHCLGSPGSSILPQHPRICRYVAPSRRVAGWIAEAGGIPHARLDVVPNAVDLLRFDGARQSGTTPRRALIYDDLQLPDSAVATAIRSATGDLGMELDLLGRRLGRVVDKPEQRLPRYDVVFATGRKAIEALACGCAVVVLGNDTCGELVDEANFDALLEDDFSAPGDAPLPSSDRIRDQLRRYAPASCAWLAAEIRRRAGFPLLVERLERVYRVAIAASEGAETDLAAEEKAASDYLFRLSLMIKEMERLQKAKGDVPISIASLFLELSAKLSTIQADLDKPQWWPDQRRRQPN